MGNNVKNTVIALAQHSLPLVGKSVEKSPPTTAPLISNFPPSVYVVLPTTTIGSGPTTNFDLLFPITSEGSLNLITASPDSCFPHSPSQSNPQSSTMFEGFFDFIFIVIYGGLLAQAVSTLCRTICPRMAQD